VPSIPFPEVPARTTVLSSVALGDAFDCASSALLLGECGDPEGKRAAILKAFESADGAFEPGSEEAAALAIVLSAVWLVPEVAE